MGCAICTYLPNQFQFLLKSGLDPDNFARFLLTRPRAARELHKVRSLYEVLVPNSRLRCDTQLVRGPSLFCSIPASSVALGEGKGRAGEFRVNQPSEFRCAEVKPVGSPCLRLD
jgi:hypothetical protein